VTDRAVSEVIGFLLVFSIVIISVGLLYTVGFSGLADIQESELDRSGERAFHAMAVGFEDIQRDTGRARSVDLELSGRTIAVNRTPELRAGFSGSMHSANGAFIYGFGESTEIAYTGGAVIRDQGPNSQRISRAPRFRCTGDQAVVTLVHITSGSTTSAISSDGSVQVEATGPTPDRAVTVAQSTSDPLDIEFGDSGYETAWRQYFENHDEWSVSGTTATCSPSEAAFVRVVPVTIEYGSGG